MTTLTDRSNKVNQVLLLGIMVVEGEGGETFPQCNVSFQTVGKRPKYEDKK